MFGRFGVHAQEIGAGIQKITDEAIHGLDHEMNVHRAIDARGTQRFEHQRTDGEVGHVMVVHYVKMNDIRARGQHRFDLGAETREIRCEDGRCNPGFHSARILQWFGVVVSPSRRFRATALLESLSFALLEEPLINYQPCSVTCGVCVAAHLIHILRRFYTCPMTCPMDRPGKWLLASCCALLAGLPAANGSSAEKNNDRPDRAAVVANEYAQDGEVAAAADDDSLWLEEAGGRALVLRRSVRRGPPQGSVIVLSATGHGPGGLSHAASLRRSLALHGWETYFLKLPETVPGAAQGSGVSGSRVQAAVAMVRGRTSAGLVLLIAEGSASQGLGTGLSGLNVDGLVLLNLPVTRASRNLLAEITTPTFLLQEHPAYWQKSDPLTDDVELQQLPRSYARPSDGRVLRRIRGWINRRYPDRGAERA